MEASFSVQKILKVSFCQIILVLPRSPSVSTEELKGIHPNMYNTTITQLFCLKLSRTEPSRTEPNLFASKVNGVSHIMLIYGF